jgi:hypothetical protein
VITEIGLSERSGLVAGEVADLRSDKPVDNAIEMGTAVTSFRPGTVGEDTLDPRERNQNGKQRKRSEVLAAALALGHWKSGSEHAAQQQTPEVAQLHRTIAKMANMLQTHPALDEAQW